MIRTFAITAPAILACSLLSSAAFAGPVEDFNRGVKAYQHDKYEDAIASFEASMKSRPNSNTALYLGNAYLKLGRLDDARDAFESVLRLEPKHPKRAGIAALVKTIDARVEVPVRIETNPPGARVFIDGSSVSLGVTPIEVVLPVGPRRIALQKEGYEPLSHELTLTARKKSTVNEELIGKGCELTLSAVDRATTNAVPGATLALDRNEPAQLPFKTMVKKGEHNLRVVAASFNTKEQVVQCDGVTPATIPVSLDLAKGRVAIPVAAGTIVMVDGKVVTLSPQDAAQGVGLLPGRHEVTVTVGNADPKTSIIDVRANEVIAFDADKLDGGAFNARSMYVELVGGGTLTLRDWNLGSNAFVAQNGTVGLAPKSSGMGGIRVGYQVSARFAAELEAAYISLPNRLDTSHGLTYNVNLVYHLMATRWTPILEGGVGAYQVFSGNLGNDVAMRGHLGLGLRGRVTRSIAIRADVRDVVSKGFESGGSNNLELLAGAELSF